MRPRERERERDREKERERERKERARPSKELTWGEGKAGKLHLADNILSPVRNGKAI